MRRWHARLSWIGWVGLLCSGPAGAVPVPFSGTLEIVFAEGGLGALSASAAGVTEVDPATLRFELPAGLFTLSGVLPGPTSGPVTAVEVEASNAEGWPLGEPVLCPPVCPPLAPLPAPGSGMPLAGALRLHLGGERGVISLPLSVLGVGSASAYFNVTHASASGVQAVLAGARWVFQTATAWLSTGNPHVAAVTGFDARDSLGHGTLQLVTPMRLTLDGALYSGLSGYGRLTLVFVPEPASILLVALGACGLLWLGRTRDALVAR